MKSLHLPLASPLMAADLFFDVVQDMGPKGVLVLP